MRSSVEPIDGLRLFRPIHEPSPHVYRAMLTALAGLVETRDAAAGDHLQRIGRYCDRVTRRLSPKRGEQGPRVAYASRGFARMVVNASALHDIGKAVIPDAILLKPGPLTSTEMDCVRQHTVAGHQTISRVIDQVGPHPFLTLARDIAYCHHECWDGSGYPRGLRGNEIPLSARIVAVADVYDALVSRRCYKAPMCETEAREIIAEGAGGHFDPAVVDAFLAEEPEPAAV